MAKVAELTSKVEELSAKNKENNDSGKSNGAKTASTVSPNTEKSSSKEEAQK